VAKRERGGRTGKKGATDAREVRGPERWGKETRSRMTNERVGGSIETTPGVGKKISYGLFRGTPRFRWWVINKYK